eukprot:bmy_07165T0
MGKHFSTAFPAFLQKPKPPHKQKTTLCFIKKITQLQVPMLPGSPLKNGSEKSPVLRASIIKPSSSLMKTVGGLPLPSGGQCFKNADNPYRCNTSHSQTIAGSAFNAIWDLPLIQVFHWSPSTPFSLNGTPCSLHTPMPLGCSMAPCPSPQRYNLSHLSGPLKAAWSLKSSLDIPSGSAYRVATVAKISSVNCTFNEPRFHLPFRIELLEVLFHFMQPMGKESYPNCRLCTFSLLSRDTHNESINALWYFPLMEQICKLNCDLQSFGYDDPLIHHTEAPFESKTPFFKLRRK